MAIVKHNSSQNARYEDVLEYYTCRHREDSRTGHYEPILDEHGLMQTRSNCAALYLTADGTEAAPERCASACRRTNLRYGKNNKPGDRKSHEYILSHPAVDRDKLSLDDLLEEGRAFTKTFLQGYDCLIAVHRDTDNDHIHISLNSVRAGARAEREWMMRDGEGNILPCEIKGGGKHQDSAELRRAMNDWLRDYTRTHGWEVKDNNAIVAKRRRERYEKRNEYLRHVLVSVVSQCRSTKELTRRLRTYGITLKRRGNTVSVLPPGGRRAVRLRTLGLEWVDIERLMALRRERERLAEQQWWAYVRCVRRRWYEARREAYGHSHGALDSLLILVLFLLLGDVPKPQAAYSEPECLALFGPPDKAETEAFQGLAYAREQDLQTPQEIEWKEAELRSAIRRARIDCDQSALEAALDEWRKLQMLQTSIRSIHYTAERGKARRPEREQR